MDLLQWYAQGVLAGNTYLGLIVQERDTVMKRIRAAISKMDDLIVARLETDRRLRTDFLFRELLPPLARDIGAQRSFQRFIDQIGPCAEVIESDEYA